MVRYALNRIEMSLFTIIFFVEDEYEGNTTDQVAHLCHIIEINIIRYIELMPLILKIAEILFLYQTNIIRFDRYILVILFTDTDTIRYPTFFSNTN